MVYLNIKFTKQSEKEVKKLETILNTWDLRIIECETDEKKSVLKLSINASMPITMNLIVSIAQSRFQDDLLESHVHYEAK